MGRRKIYVDCPYPVNSNDYHKWHSKRWYNSQTPEQLKERNKYRAVVRHRNKMMIIEEMGNKCADCGVSYEHYVYDFHHLDGLVKDRTLNKILNCSLERAREEAAKCVLLCANCHRLRHKGEHNRASRSQTEIYS